MLGLLGRSVCFNLPAFFFFFGQHPWGPGEARLPSLLGGSSPGSSPVGRVAFAFPLKNSTIPRFRHLEHVFRGDHISIKSPPRKKQFVEALHITRQNIFLSCDITFLTSSRIGAKISALITIGTSCWDCFLYHGADLNPTCQLRSSRLVCWSQCYGRRQSSTAARRRCTH